MQKLFAAIDEEPARKPSAASRFGAGIAQFFAGLSPRTLAWSAGAAAVALLLQAGVIGAVLVNQQTNPQLASLSEKERPATTTRELRAGKPPRAFVRFAPDAKMSDIDALLSSYDAVVVGSANGMFSLQFGSETKSRDEVAGLLSKLRGEKIVSLAEPSAP